MKVKTQTKPVEILTVAETIRAEIAKGDARYREVGRLFAEQKAQLGHGQWLPWLAAEGFQERTARNYMAYAKSETTFRYADWLDAQKEDTRVKVDVAHPLHGQKVVAKNVATDARVKADAGYQEELEEALELEEQPLARRLVNIGFKRLAAVLHPDKGGTSEAMNRLVNVRAKLTVLLEGDWA